MNRVQEIQKYVTSRINRYPHIDPGQAKAEIARLRRGAGKKLEQCPDLWGVFLQSMPEDLIGKGSSPSRAENIIFLTMTLFSEAQQGHEVADLQMDNNVSLGTALGKVVTQEKKGPERDSANDRIASRLKRLVLSSSIEEMAMPLRSLIGILRQKEITLDYGRLAGDLYNFSFPNMSSQIGLKWARDYYRELNRAEYNKQTNEQENAE